jgi:pimeloyl-ACP methyl ester carboxylesterase
VTAVSARSDVEFEVGGAPCAAWHYAGEGDVLDAGPGRPCVVMAHGIGGTRDSGLEAFADAFAAAGADVLLFDYRCLGASAGEPRGLVSPGRQLADYRAAVATARSLAGVDPDRIVLWGVSLSGGHVFEVAAHDDRVAAVIALTPAGDGLATSLALLRSEGPILGLRLTAAALRDVTASTRSGGSPVYVPLAGEPGTTAALTAPGALAAYEAIGGPTWRNRIPARCLLSIPAYRPARKATAVRCPVLVQVADEDRSVPPASQMAAGERSRAEVRHYPCDHFDVHPGGEWFEPAVEHQVAFLRRRLGSGTDAR